MKKSEIKKKLLEKTFKEVESVDGGFTHKDKGDYYYVVEQIASSSMYGFAQDVAKSVIKFKSISDKQAEILSKVTLVK